MFDLKPFVVNIRPLASQVYQLVLTKLAEINLPYQLYDDNMMQIDCQHIVAGYYFLKAGGGEVYTPHGLKGGARDYFYEATMRFLRNLKVDVALEFNQYEYDCIINTYGIIVNTIEDFMQSPSIDEQYGFDSPLYWGSQWMIIYYFGQLIFEFQGTRPSELRLTIQG